MRRLTLDAAARSVQRVEHAVPVRSAAENAAAFEAAIAGAAHARIGQVTEGDRLVIRSGDATVVESDLAALKEAWQKPLRWHETTSY